MDEKRAPDICLVTFPSESRVPYIFIAEEIEILDRLSGRLNVIGERGMIETPVARAKIRDIGVRMHFIGDVKPKIYSMLLWLWKILIIEVKTAVELFRCRDETDIVIFFMAYPYFLLPLAMAKVTGKKTVEIVTRTRSKSDPAVIRLFRAQDRIMLSLLDRISPESPSLINQLGFERYNGKITAPGMRFIDMSRFRADKDYRERKNMVGFVGRLREGKGAMSFVEAFPAVKEQCPDVEFFIAGEGELYDAIRKKAAQEDGKITVSGWIDHRDIPACLNELKLLVLPSQSEGLPTIVIEAMACGTPVLATAAGAIPDLVKDGETGFMLGDSSPESIASGIIHAIRHPSVEQISANARSAVQRQLTFEAAVERYRKIVNDTREA